MEAIDGVNAGIVENVATTHMCLIHHVLTMVVFEAMQLCLDQILIDFQNGVKEQVAISICEAHLLNTGVGSSKENHMGVVFIDKAFLHGNGSGQHLLVENQMTTMMVEQVFDLFVVLIRHDDSLAVQRFECLLQIGDNRDVFVFDQLFQSFTHWIVCTRGFDHHTGAVQFRW